MILETLISLVSFYPWNIGASLYGTSGYYSTGKSYFSKAIYISMDRRGKDGFTVGYEDLRISNENEANYRQYNLFARDVFWIKPELRFGGVIGHFNTNSSDDGWMWGSQIEGDLPWFGYAVGYSHSDYQNWQPLLVDFLNTKEITIKQWDGALSRRIGSHIFRFSIMTQTLDHNQYWTYSGNWIIQPIKSLLVSATYSFGESRYSIDPYLLILNNTPDILNQLLSVRIGYRITPNWSISGVYSRHDYSDGENNYQVNFLALGIQGRF